MKMCSFLPFSRAFDDMVYLVDKYAPWTNAKSIPEGQDI